MNRYQYYVNNNPVSKKEMVSYLKEKCNRIVNKSYVNGIGIDISEFDREKFYNYMRKIEQGHIVLIDNKTFRRKRN